jgi:predicted ribosomally synthesized six-cysteine peptide SCIFF
MNCKSMIMLGGKKMKHIKTLNSGSLKESASHGGCGECQTSCQSACKTSCTVGNQSCENK